MKNKFLVLLNAIKNPHHQRPIYYRLSSISIEEQTAILHVVNKSIFIKQTFSEIISNSDVIEGLSCEHACWIGVYYGKALRNALDRKTNLKNIKKPSYLLQHKYGHYKIICENRDGTIGCIHTKTRNELNAHPLSIAQDKIFINYFDVSQACYIGILAGISIEKKQYTSLTGIKKQIAPYLRIVK